MTILDKFKSFAPAKNELGQNNNAIIYTRVSTKEQADTNTVVPPGLVAETDACGNLIIRMQSQ